MALRSLRSRLVVGALLWTAGLTLVVHFSSLAIIRHFAHAMWHVHFALMTIVALGLLAAALVQVRSGLDPLHRVRQRLAAVREGRERRMGGDYPSEVQPLVDDLNALLDDRERRVARAQARAGDLAHGLKTPLAVMAQDAARARASGQVELADALDEQIERMRGQMDYHLAQARAAVSSASPDARCLVSESAQGLARTLLRLHAERGLALDVHVAAEHAVRVQRADLDEMLGNLLDNACRWARTRVELRSALERGRVVLAVDDDGPGIAPELRAAVLQRGVRADQAGGGSGFGLAIVRDLADVYGGSITLEASPLGGLRARLELPAAG